jgi:hypothetical protein
VHDGEGGAGELEAVDAATWQQALREGFWGREGTWEQESPVLGGGGARRHATCIATSHPRPPILSSKQGTLHIQQVNNQRPSSMRGCPALPTSIEFGVWGIQHEGAGPTKDSRCCNRPTPTCGAELMAHLPWHVNMGGMTSKSGPTIYIKLVVRFVTVYRVGALPSPL